MKIYRVDADDERFEFFGIMLTAHRAAKLRMPRAGVRINLIEVPTSKAAIVRLLQEGASAIDGITPDATWRLSARGALVPHPVGE